MKLNNRVAIVTGGGTGIGKAISLAFASEGATVVVAARTLPRLEAVADEIRSRGGRATAIQTDITDESQVRDLVSQTIDEYGQVDILVNDSGIAATIAKVVDVDLDDWNRVLAVDLTGAMLTAKTVLKSMTARRSGNIINISSEAGIRGWPYRSPYCVAKWGLIGLTRTLALEVARYGIRVNCIAPGTVEGERMDNSLKAVAESSGRTYEEVRSATVAGAALKRMVTAVEIAGTAVFLASDDSSGITGETINVNAGSHL